MSEQKTIKIRMTDKIDDRYTVTETKKEIPDNTQKAKTSNDKKQIKILIVLCVLLFVVCGCLGYLIYDSRPTEINAAKYVKVDFSGINGNGIATAKLNTEQLNIEVSQVLKKRHVLKDDVEKEKILAEIDNAVFYSLNQTTGLKNKDIITLSVSANNDYLKRYKITIPDVSKEIKVDGIDEPENVDPFRDIRVIFDGISGNITARFVNDSTNEYIENMSFYFQGATTHLKIGDYVTVACDNSCSNCPYTFSRTSRTYKIEKADRYAEKLSDIPAEDSKKLKTKAMETLSNRFTNKEYSAHNWKYEGSYLVCSKRKEFNQLYMVFSTQITTNEEDENSFKYFKPQTIYTYAKFDNLIVKDDSSLECTSEYIETPSNSVQLGDSWLYIYCGYKDIDALYADAIASFTADCSIVKSKSFSESKNASGTEMLQPVS